MVLAGVRRGTKPTTNSRSPMRKQIEPLKFINVGDSLVAKIIIEIDTDEDEEIIELIMRLIELLEKSRQAGR